MRITRPKILLDLYSSRLLILKTNGMRLELSSRCMKEKESALEWNRKQRP